MNKKIALSEKFRPHNFKSKNFALKNNFVRYNFSGEQRNYAELTSQKILQNLDELRTQVSATSHFEYINREKNIQVVVIVFSLCIICRLGE